MQIKYYPRPQALLKREWHWQAKYNQLLFAFCISIPNCVLCVLLLTKSATYTNVLVVQYTSSLYNAIPVLCNFYRYQNNICNCYNNIISSAHSGTMPTFLHDIIVLVKYSLFWFQHA